MVHWGQLKLIISKGILFDNYACTALALLKKGDLGNARLG
jgi:hypothetical protein